MILLRFCRLLLLQKPARLEAEKREAISAELRLKVSEESFGSSVGIEVKAVNRV